MSSGINSNYGFTSMNSSEGIFDTQIRALSELEATRPLDNRFRMILGENIEEPPTPKIYDIQPIIPKEEPLYVQVMHERKMLRTMHQKTEYIGRQGVKAVTLTCQAPDGQKRYYFPSPKYIIETCSINHGLIIKDNNAILPVIRDSALAQREHAAIKPCIQHIEGKTRVQSIWDRLWAQFPPSSKDGSFLNPISLIDVSVLSTTG
jgi:hypothetical protein